MKLSVRKPRIGSLFVWMRPAIMVGTPWLLAGTMLAEAGTKRFPLTPEMIVGAMELKQLPVKDVEIRLSAPMTALSDHPALDIQTIHQVSPHSAQLKMVCRDHSQCLSFLAFATWPDTSAALSLPAGPVHQTTPTRIPQLSSSLPPQTVAAIVKAGSPATLLIEDAKIHIRLQVVCLQSGSAGDKVRVSTPDHKVGYKAQVISPNLLKGSF